MTTFRAAIRSRPGKRAVRIASIGARSTPRRTTCRRRPKHEDEEAWTPEAVRACEAWCRGSTSDAGDDTLRATVEPPPSAATANGDDAPPLGQGVTVDFDGVALDLEE